ncbi:MAG: ArsR/SmtB family transcription factor [Planctomycetota bacterium]|jgi:DNA-binding transcriptional ArsR family regulator
MKTSTSVELLGDEALEGAAECLRTLAHPHRLRMVQMLLQAEFTVGELAAACSIPSHMASEHLRLMRDRGLLDFERRGRRIYYHIVETGLAGLLHCIEGRFGPSEASLPTERD